MKTALLFFPFACIKPTKKSHIVTTYDFQKTNYLKTNLLKQIKKISTVGFSSKRINFMMCKYRHYFISVKIFWRQNSLKTMKKTAKKWSAINRPLTFVILTLQTQGLPSCFSIHSLMPDYIMPPMPGLPIGIAAFSSGLSTMRHSVVRNIPAIEAAFSNATRATLAGSITPALRISS